MTVSIPHFRAICVVLAMLSATLVAAATGAGAVGTSPGCAYISNGAILPSGPRVVTRVDLATNTLGNPLPYFVGTQGPRSPAIAITPDGRAVLSGQQVAGNDPISVFDLTDDSRSVAGGNVQWLKYITVSPDGSYALAVSAGLTVFNGAARLQAFSLSDLSNPIALGRVNLPEAIGSFNNAVAVAITPDGTKAYVTSPFFDVVYEIDVSNPTSPVLVTTISTVTAGNSIAISSDGATAYMPQGSAGVLPIDVSTNTPGSPIALPAGNAARLEISGTTAYVLTGGAASGEDSLTLIDLSNPASPMVGTPIVLGDGTEALRALVVTEDATTAYVAGTDSAGDPVVHVVDLGTLTRDGTASDAITAVLPSTLSPTGIVVGPCVFAADTDGDGVTDDIDNCVDDVNPLQENNDLDALGDVCDPDDDNDGTPDVSDAFPFDPAEDTDTDGDGVGDNADLCVGDDAVGDTDSDGQCDDLDPFPNDPDNDIDGDGIGGDVDNCPAIPNPGQANNDGDSLGDACDPDDDNDGTPDASDAFPFDPAEDTDTDGDLIGNNADTDDDNDGQTDVDEVACGSDPLDDLSLSPDNDGDNSPNCVDPDDDNDGFDDASEIAEGSDPFDEGSIPPTAASEAVVAELEGVQSALDPDSKAADQVGDALKALNKALEHLGEGKTDKALDDLAKAIKDLEDAEEKAQPPGSLDLTDIKVTLTAVARTAALADVDQAAGIDPGSDKVADGYDLIVEGDALRDGDPADYEEAIKKYKKAADKVMGLLP